MSTTTIYMVMGGMSYEGSHAVKAFTSEVSANNFAEWCEGGGHDSRYGDADYYYVTEMELDNE